MPSSCSRISRNTAPKEHQIDQDIRGQRLNDIHLEQPSLDYRTRNTSVFFSLFNWIPVFLLAYPMLLSPFVAQFSSGDGSDNNIVASQSNTLNQLFWIGVFGLTVFSAGRRLLRVAAIFKNPVFWVLVGYLALALVSVAWSPVPAIGFRRFVLQCIIVLCLIISVSLTDDPQLLVSRLLKLMVVIVLSNSLAVAVLPPTPLGHAGLYAQKNGLGAVMALAFLFSVYGVVARRGWRRIFMAAISCLAFALLLLSQSKTSIGLSLLMPFIAFTVVGLAYYFRANAALLLLFSAVMAVVAWLFFSAVTRFDFIDLSILLFNDETYTGRTVIWAFIVDVISRAPFFGQGYSSFWAIGTDSIVYREAPGFVVSLLQAHNGYLDVMVETGLVGFLFLVVLILTALFSTARAVPLNPQLAFLCYSLMLFVICHNMLESSWFRGYSLNWLVFLITASIPGSLSRSRSRTPA